MPYGVTRAMCLGCGVVQATSLRRCALLTGFVSVTKYAPISKCPNRCGIWRSLRITVIESKQRASALLNTWKYNSTAIENTKPLAFNYFIVSTANGCDLITSGQAVPDTHEFGSVTVRLSPAAFLAHLSAALTYRSFRPL